MEQLVNPLFTVKDLSMFDAEDYRAMTHISPFEVNAGKSAAFRLKALENLEEADAILGRAARYDSKNPDYAALVAAMLQSAKIRFAAAAHCENMSICWLSAAARRYPD